MNQIEKNKSKTDQAWEQLYTRLEQDGLLDKPISGTQIPYRIGPFHKSDPVWDL